MLYTSARNISYRRRGMGGGVDHSSDEASNDRGAKGWQIVRTREGNFSPTHSEGGISYDNETRAYRSTSKERQRVYVQ